MREIGTIDREDDARILADYLLTLDISTKVVDRADGSWAVWVHKEDRVPQARQILEEFAADAANPRYRAAVPTAREIRKKVEKEEAGYRKRVRDLRDRWEGPIYNRAPLTFTLMVISIIVTAVLFAHINLSWSVSDILSYSIVTNDIQGFRVDHGLQNIRQGEVWRLITPIFLHGGMAHLFFNMLALIYLGDRIETRKGTWRLLAFVIVTAVLSNSGQFLHSGGSFGGMSGVIFAMAGYLWVKGHVDPGDGLSLDPRSTNWMLGWLALGFIAAEFAPQGAQGFPYNMANIAHAVGIVSGMIIGALRL
ncbi:rhomboid family intramembrane serine protease [Tundrisphaera lichenicola]|uniref:rhomboid family intramembrane serine protease n=1 Tax=Tundrisphaera lichenicola TaxID=2029860 RepID=UPI003EB8254B